MSSAVIPTTESSSAHPHKSRGPWSLCVVRGLFVCNLFPLIAQKQPRVNCEIDPQKDISIPQAVWPFTQRGAVIHLPPAPFCGTEGPFFASCFELCKSVFCDGLIDFCPRAPPTGLFWSLSREPPFPQQQDRSAPIVLWRAMQTNDQ